LSIASLHSKALAHSSHPIDRLWVTLASGERLRVIFKRPQPGQKLHGNEREVLIYQRLLADGRFGAPALYASVFDEARGRYWLFLEDVGYRTLKHQEIECWLAALRRLGEMHASYLGREDELRALECLGEHGPFYYYELVKTARRSLLLVCPPKTVARFDRLMASFDSVITHLACQPRTLVHGDIFPRNLMVQRGRRIRPIDWESAAIGLAAWDLARLLDGWGEDRRDLIATYRAEFDRFVSTPIDWRSFERTFEYCQLVNELWYFQWSPEFCQNSAWVDSALKRMKRLRGRLDR
jgi:hypothetical protein